MNKAVTLLLKRTATASGALVLLVSSAAGFAQTTSSGGSAALEEIIVTARSGPKTFRMFRYPFTRLPKTCFSSQALRGSRICRPWFLV